MLHTFVTSCLHKLVCVCLAVISLTVFSHRIFKHRIILTKYFTWKYQTLLHFICRCSYLFTFLLFSQFHWHILWKSTAYFFDPPCSWLLMLPASSGERLCNGTVSIYPSVCLSVPSTCSWFAAEFRRGDRYRSIAAGAMYQLQNDICCQWRSQKFSTDGASICSIPFCPFPFSCPTKSAVQSKNVMTYHTAWMIERTMIISRLESTEARLSLIDKHIGTSAGFYA